MTKEEYLAGIGAEREKEIEVVARAIAFAHGHNPDDVINVPIEAADFAFRTRVVTRWQLFREMAISHIAAFDAIWEHRKMPKRVTEGY